MGNSVDNPDYTLAYRDLISLDLSDVTSEDEYFKIPEHNPSLQTETEFQQEINRLKAASGKRFKDKWEEILAKYAAIDDDKASDEIDLATGKITIDNGHLRSLKNQHLNGHSGVNNNVWTLNYDDERDFRNAQRREKVLAKRKQQLKEQLKARDQFYNSSHSHFSPLKSLGASPNKSSSISPTKKISPDNILLLDPSPTKKQRVSPTKMAPELPSQRIEISDSEDLYTLLEDPGSNSKSKMDKRLQISDSSTPIKFPSLASTANEIKENDEVLSITEEEEEEEEEEEG